MKKIYQTPATFMTVVELQQMIAVSKVENGFNMGIAPETEETSGNLSRRRSVWDDEEEEETEEF